MRSAPEDTAMAIATPIILATEIAREIGDILRAGEQALLELGLAAQALRAQGAGRTA